MANRRTGVAAVLAFLLALVAGCTGSTGTTDLPAANGLLQTASASMRSATSVHFTIGVQGTLASVPVQSAEGDLNSQGQAKGSAKLSELGQLIQVDFVLVDGSFYLKGLTGGYQKLPAKLAGSVFDPSAILDPNRGVAKVLASLGDPRTEAQEQVDGQQTYRISGTVAKGVVSALIPGITSDVATKVWVTTDAKHLPVKAEFAVPGTDGAQGATVDVDISKINEPVTVTAPS
jgi:lipoprotein LprG